MILEQVLTLGSTLGILGLFALALIDSGGIPTGGGPDLLLGLLVVQRADLSDVLMAAPAAALGSLIGSLVLYNVGRYGRTPLLKRFGSRRVESVIPQLHRFGPLAMMLAVIAPPPFPMKVFVLSAGALRLRLRQFCASVFIGRAIRYAIVFMLALRYGEAALAHLSDHVPSFMGLLLGLVALSWLLRRLWLRRRDRRGDEVAAMSEQTVETRLRAAG
jgi:membrane protein YqaA with SNARE-associated domain